MAPIMSPKILHEILMYGGAAEVDSQRPLTLPAIPRARPALTLSAGEAVISSATVHRMVYSRARYTSLPNSNFIFHTAKPSRTTPKHILDIKPAPVASQDATVSTPVSSSDCGSADGHVTLDEEVLADEKAVEHSAPSSAACSEPTELIVSTVNSVRSSISSSQPSTAATSVSPWMGMYAVADPVAKFGAPQVAVPRYTRARPPPADSIHITRKRRASEVAERSTGIFVSRTRKISDARGLKGLGMRTLQAFKKVRW